MSALGHKRCDPRTQRAHAARLESNRSDQPSPRPATSSVCPRKWSKAIARTLTCGRTVAPRSRLERAMTRQMLSRRDFVVLFCRRGMSGCEPTPRVSAGTLLSCARAALYADLWPMRATATGVASQSFPRTPVADQSFVPGIGERTIRIHQGVEKGALERPANKIAKHCKNGKPCTS